MLDSIRPIRDDWGVTVIDEKSHVPALDEAALERLAAAFDRDGVVAAMLIGSQARGTAGPLSDVDVAVWHDPGLPAGSLLSLQLKLAKGARRALHTEEVDVVMLNQASPLLRQRAVRDAKRLIERDRGERVRMETQAILDYLDTKPLRAELARGLRHRIEEDRFGRPEGISKRLERLGTMVEELERIHTEGRQVYDTDLKTRLAADHAIQVSVQARLDVGAHLVAELGLPAPDDYRGVFDSLRPVGLDPELADRLEDAAGMRNVLVHGYLDVDRKIVWEALERLDDLREFAAFVRAKMI